MKLFHLTLALAPIVELATISIALAAEPAGGDAPLVVQLENGESYSGTLGPESDGEHLDLVVQRPSITLTRSLSWDAVARVSGQGQDFSAAEFRQKIEQLRQQSPAARPTETTTITLIGHDTKPAHAAASPARRAASPVRHLSIDAELGGWTDTVEADGLIVYVQPVDAAGRAVAVDGTLEVDLTGMRQGVARPSQPFEKIGQWSEPVRCDDFGPRGAIYRLPFQSVDPQYDVNLAAKGLVHARLSVPGQGTFDATETDVRIRPYSAFRDASQMTDGERYFPQEQTQGP